MQTALVTGGSRGVGRGAAIGLAEAGFRVLATGRTVATANLPDSVERLACDHRRDDDTAAPSLGWSMTLAASTCWSGVMA